MAALDVLQLAMGFGERGIMRHSVRNMFAALLLVLLVAFALPALALANPSEEPMDEVATNTQQDPTPVNDPAMGEESVARQQEGATASRGSMPADSSTSEGDDRIILRKGPLSQDAEKFVLVPVEGGHESEGDDQGGLLDAQAVDTQQLRALILTAAGSGSRENVNIARYGINSDDFMALYEKTIEEAPDLFFCNGGCSVQYYPDTGQAVSFTPSYEKYQGDLSSLRAEYNAGLADMLSWVPFGASDLEKVKAVHDWLCWNVTYDDAAVESGNHTWYDHNAYGALVKRVCVCDGYSEAFACAMKRLGIPCTVVSAHNHSWNRVRVGGSWYHLDATWDQNFTSGYERIYWRDPTSTIWFLKSDAGMQAQDKAHSSYYRYGGEITHSGYGTGEVPGNDTRYDGYVDDDWNTYRVRLFDNAVTALSLGGSSLRMSTFEERDLKISSISPQSVNTSVAVWSSDNPSIAYVSAGGHVVAADRVGTTNVTCTAGGVTASCKVTVCGQLEDAVVSSIADQTYTGYALTPKPTVTYVGTQLKEGVDYTLSYARNSNAGTATVTITGKGSYMGSVSRTFRIVAKTFPDVSSGTWYASVVSRAAGIGLVNGYANGRFGPNDRVTRGQVAVILWNMAGKPSARGAGKSFPDVKRGKYYYDAVRWASSVGVVNGYANGRFGPDDNVTREQFATMLANYASKIAGKKVTGSSADYKSMRDASSVSAFARRSVGWCFRNKILSGAKGRVNPQGSTTRAETAKMVVFEYDLLR